MTHRRKFANQPAAEPRGLTLMESIVSVAIVSVLMVASLNAVGAAQVARQKTSVQARGQLLAHDLLTEILSKAYDDPQGAGILGLDLAEILGIDRTTLDDIDDYEGLSDSPPTYADGTPLDGFDASWSRAVKISYVDPVNPGTVSVSDAGAKRIAIEVKHINRTVAEIAVIRTRGWQGSNP
jgi:prepilin-type N-terminal cleavage/methylation domain-containing protein